MLRSISLAALAMGWVAPAFALNILLVNDDGLTANIQALHASLTSAGHDVIVSVPCQNQSGKGASLNFLNPIKPLTKACLNNAAPAGAPGAGPVEGMADFHYVDGTPVMATLYGLDVLVPARWGRAPDLVISGPNEGQNTGPIVISSGTVSNAQAALARGLPAIAVSADSDTKDNAALAAEVADITLNLLNTLEEKARSGPVLPEGVALNVNIPKFAAGTSAGLPWSLSRHGTYSYIQLKFVSDLSQDPVAQAYGLGSQPYPGLVVTLDAAEPDASQAKDEGAVNAAGAVAVTAMQLGYDAKPDLQHRVQQRLQGLFADSHSDPR